MTFAAFLLITIIIGIESKTDKAWAQQAVEDHNHFRKNHGVGPLTHNEKLCDIIQPWVENLANSGRFEHNPKLQTLSVGENLASFTTSQTNKEPKSMEAIQAWYNEKSEYDFNTGKFSSKTGHFTQLVWKATTSICCAYSTKISDRMLTTVIGCNYSPAGNMMGEFKKNVFPDSNQNGSARFDVTALVILFTASINMLYHTHFLL